MENKATNILELQIKEIQDSIIQNKVDIADLFIKIHNSGLFSSNNKNLDTDEVFENMEKMPKLIKMVSDNEAKYQMLLDIKEKLNNSDSLELAV